MIANSEKRKQNILTRLFNVYVVNFLQVIFSTPMKLLIKCVESVINYYVLIRYRVLSGGFRKSIGQSPIILAENHQRHLMEC